MKTQTMITYAYFTIGTWSTKGNSESAGYVSDQICYSQSLLRGSDFYFSVMKRALPDLLDVKKSYSKPSWDGYDARPLSNG